MKFPEKYKALDANIYSEGEYSLIPIRYEDRLDILKWRNEQMIHLRQREPLTKEGQDRYFQEVVSKLFEVDQPDQILFSFLKNGVLIGYGGLVHIDWPSKNAEISFIINTELEKKYFNESWKEYVSLLYKYAFDDLKLHKIYTYAFDVRPYLYAALEEGGLQFEARLKEHCLFEGKFVDVLMHSKINRENLYLRKANIDDALLMHYWVNEEENRKNSLSQESIPLDNHLQWLRKRLNNHQVQIFILIKDNIPIGNIRLEKENELWKISYQIDKNFRGQGYGKKIISMLIEKYPGYSFIAEVKKENIASVKIFQNLGFSLLKEDSPINTYIKKQI